MTRIRRSRGCLLFSAVLGLGVLGCKARSSDGADGQGQAAAGEAERVTVEPPPREGPLPCGARTVDTTVDENACEGQWTEAGCVELRERFEYDDRGRLARTRAVVLGAGEAEDIVYAYPDDSTVTVTRRKALARMTTLTRTEENLKFERFGSLLVPRTGEGELIRYDDRQVELDELGRPTSMRQDVIVEGVRHRETCSFDYPGGGGRPIVGITEGYVSRTCQKDGEPFEETFETKWRFEGPARGPSTMTSSGTVMMTRSKTVETFEYECSAAPEPSLSARLPIPLGASSGEVRELAGAAKADELRGIRVKAPWGSALLTFEQDELVRVAYDAESPTPGDAVDGRLAGDDIDDKPLGLRWTSSIDDVVAELGDFDFYWVPRGEPTTKTLSWLEGELMLYAVFDRGRLAHAGYARVTTRGSGDE